MVLWMNGRISALLEEGGARKKTDSHGESENPVTQSPGTSGREGAKTAFDRRRRLPIQTGGPSELDRSTDFGARGE